MFRKRPWKWRRAQLEHFTDAENRVIVKQRRPAIESDAGSQDVAIGRWLVAGYQLAFITRSLAKFFVILQNCQRLRHVSTAIVGGVAPVSTRRSAQRKAVGVQKSILHSEREKPVPRLPACIRQIDQRLWRSRNVRVITGVLIKKRNG